MSIILLLLLFLTFFLIGDKICSQWKLSFSGAAEALLICTAIGLVAISCSTTLLAFLGLIYPATPWALIGLVFIASLKRAPKIFRAFYLEVKSLPPGMGWFNLFNLVVLCVLFLGALALALTPPTRTDALVYHLAIPKAYLEHHGVTNLPNNLFSFFPLQMEMVYLFCLAMGGEILAKLVGLGMAVLLLLALTLFYKRNLSAQYLTLVPVLFFSTPTFFELSTTAYVDLTVAGFIFLAYYAWNRWRTENAWFFPMALFIGAASATKLTSVIIIPIALIGILWRKQSVRESLKPAFILGFWVLMFMLPWWGKNHYYSGNPFFPLLMEVFGGEDRANWDINRFSMFNQYITAFGMGRGVKEFFLLPVNLTFFSEKNGLRFDGQIGILYFLLLPGLFFLWRGNSKAREHTGRLALVFAVLLIFWFSHFQYIRFLASIFTFLTLLLAYGFEQATLKATPSGPLTKPLLHILVAIAIAYNLSLISPDWLRAEPLPYLLGQQSRDQYLAKHIPTYPMYQTLNRTLNKDDVALLVYMRNLGYLARRKFVSDSIFEAHTLQTILDRDLSVDGVSRQLRGMGITYLIFDNNFVFGKDSAFSPKQLEVLKDFINSRAKLVERKNSFCLYRLVLD